MIAVIGLLIFRKLSRALQVFTVYLIIAACTELLSYLFAFRHESNLYFLHAFTMLEFWFIAIFFYNIVDFSKLKLSLYTILFIGTLLIIGNTIFVQGLDVFNSNAATFVSVIVLLMCLMYFHSILDSSEEGIESRTIKRFVVGLFFYHCFSFAILIFGNHINDSSKSAQTIIWTTRGIFILATKFIYLSALGIYAYHYLKQAFVGKALN
jgi:hypothetical protein